MKKMKKMKKMREKGVSKNDATEWNRLLKELREIDLQLTRHTTLDTRTTEGRRVTTGKGRKASTEKTQTKER